MAAQRRDLRRVRRDWIRPATVSVYLQLRLSSRLLYYLIVVRSILGERSFSRPSPPHTPLTNPAASRWADLSAHSGRCCCSAGPPRRPMQYKRVRLDRRACWWASSGAAASPCRSRGNPHGHHPGQDPGNPHLRFDAGCGCSGLARPCRRGKRTPGMGKAVLIGSPLLRRIRVISPRLRTCRCGRSSPWRSPSSSPGCSAASLAPRVLQPPEQMLLRSAMSRAPGRARSLSSAQPPARLPFSRPVRRDGRRCRRSSSGDRSRR
jgi:hypothetical protein